MTDPLAAIEARLAQATPGLWEVDYRDITGVWRVKYPGDVYPSFVLGCYKGQSDAELCAHAPTDLQYLLTRLKAAERQIEHMANTAHQTYHHSDGNDARGWRECTRPFCKDAVIMLVPVEP